MSAIYVHTETGIAPVKELFLKENGQWVPVKEALVKDNGTWKRFYPEADGTINYTVPGTYSFDVPYGITALTATLVGGGGGGGGFRGSGDMHLGGSGGSGGFQTNISIPVIPGEVLTVVVGAGGYSATVESNGNWNCIGQAGQGGAYWNAGDGGTSEIRRGAAVLLQATGGGGGWGAGPGDNSAPSGASRPGGIPNGVAGPQPNPNRNTGGPTPGGNNGTGWGIGGNGNGISPWACPQQGGSGLVSIRW